MSEEQPSVITTSKFRLPKIFIALIVAVIAIGLGYLILRGSLPKTPTQSTPTPTPLSKISIDCPIEGFCQKAKPVVNNGNIVAIASPLPANTPIKAIFDGKTITRSVNAAGNPRETFYSVSLVNDPQQLKAVYYFKNKVNVRASLKSGEIIASTSALPMKFFDNNNFAFALLDKDNQVIPIERIEFK